MVLQNKNSWTLNELKSRMRSYESEELETNEMDDDGFSVSGDMGMMVSASQMKPSHLVLLIMRKMGEAT